MAGRSNDEIARALAGLSPDQAEPERSESEPAKPARPSQPAGAPESAPIPATTLRRPGRQLETKRTLIPIMLVLGGFLTLGGLLTPILGDEAPVDGMFLPILMIVLGLLTLAVAGVTMLQVKRMLEPAARR